MNILAKKWNKTLGMIDYIPPQKEVLSVKEVAVYLGVSESKVRQLIRRNAIPYVKIDGSYRFYLPMVQDWLRRITVQPMQASGLPNTIQDRNLTVENIWSHVEKGK